MSSHHDRLTKALRREVVVRKLVHRNQQPVGLDLRHGIPLAFLFFALQVMPEGDTRPHFLCRLAGIGQAQRAIAAHAENVGRPSQPIAKQPAGGRVLFPVAQIQPFAFAALLETLARLDPSPDLHV